MLGVVAAPRLTRCIFLRRLTFTGHGRTLFIRGAGVSANICVAPQGGGFDPSLARFTLALGIICITAGRRNSRNDRG